MIGFYRYKLDPVKVGRQSFNFVQGAKKLCTMTVMGKAKIDNCKIIKYLDHNGQYRFYPFNKFWQMSDSAEEIGNVDQISVSTASGFGRTKSIGKKNKRIYSLIAETVSPDELLLLADIPLSPRVFLYIGNGGDANSDWVAVKVKSKEFIIKNRKNRFSDFKIELEVIEFNSITML